MEYWSMLNELSQVVESLDRLGVSTESRHARINPMGKNEDLLVVCLAPDGNRNRVDVLAGGVAANLFRVEHGAAGSSFPGFNVPTPLRCRREDPGGKLVPAIEHLLALNKNKEGATHDLFLAIAAVFSLSKPRDFTQSQKSQFQRSCSELARELQEKMAGAPAGLTNFLNLLALLVNNKPTLGSFADSLTELLALRSRD